MNVLAFDLGASNGRAVVGHLDNHQIRITEVHRFPNNSVLVGERLHWDILRIYHEIKQGILKAKHLGYTQLQSMAIDSWALDFGVIGSSGELLGNPYHYRDRQTDGLIEEVCGIIPRKEIFLRTGIQFLPINTIYHLYAMKKAQSPFLEQADTLLMIPGLLRYFLTGEKKNDLTNASTTQLVNIQTGNWDHELLAKLGLSVELFGEIVKEGTIVGSLLPSVCEELEVEPFPIITVGEHDTASAVLAVPSIQKDFAYLSCGTWSLLGTELEEPIINEQSLEWNFTNEIGVHGTYRLLKNIMGLWIIQECKRVWEKEGVSFSYGDIVGLAKQAAPFQCYINPDHSMFFNPTHMPKQIQTYCRETAQYVPETKGEIIRCILESLALTYRMVFERTEILAKKSFPELHMVGGGIENVLLCKFTANAIGKPVIAGPTEASTLGNILSQYMALGQIKDIHEARSIIRNSFPITTYVPEEIDTWNEAFGKFMNVINSQRSININTEFS